jgi:hypothetical protein
MHIMSWKFGKDIWYVEMHFNEKTNLFDTSVSNPFVYYDNTVTALSLIILFSEMPENIQSSRIFVLSKWKLQN